MRYSGATLDWELWATHHPRGQLTEACDSCQATANSNSVFLPFACYPVSHQTEHRHHLLINMSVCMMQPGVPFSVFAFACSCGCISPHHLLNCPLHTPANRRCPRSRHQVCSSSCTTLYDSNLHRAMPCPCTADGKISSRPISSAIRPFAQVWLESG